jgi:flagellar biogenesis protein FliO
LIGKVGLILLLGWALRPCNRSRRDKLDRNVGWIFFVGWALRTCNKSRRDKFDRKRRVDIIGRMGFTPL